MQLHPSEGGHTWVLGEEVQQLTMLAGASQAHTIPHPPLPHGHLLFEPLLIVQFGPEVSKTPPQSKQHTHYSTTCS